MTAQSGETTVRVTFSETIKGKLSLFFVLRKMNQLEDQMSALTEAIQSLVTRISGDFDNMRALLDQALATRTEDQAEIERLRAEADAVQAELAQNIEAINAIDPDPAFPAAVDPDDDGTPADVEEPQG